MIKPRDSDSTLIRFGVRAATLTEMTEFVQTIESRPLDKLLADLPGIAGLSAAKFDLARQVVRRRANHLADVEREQLRVLADEVAASASAEVAERIRRIFA